VSDQFLDEVFRESGSPWAEVPLSLRGEEASFLKINGRRFREEGGAAYAVIAVDDISTEKLTRQALARAKDRAERVSETKNSFLAMMSHEIRTPLNSVIGFADLLSTTQLDSEQREYAAAIASSGETLLSLIKDILDYARISSRELKLNLNTFDLRGLIEDILAQYRPRAEAKRLRLLYTQETALPRMVTGDRSRLGQVLANLVENAIKFTEGGSVSLSLGCETVGEGKWLRPGFRVSDTGVGIPRALYPKLFEPFEQLDVSSTRRHGGTGLGLAVVHRLVELMGGQIHFESRRGEGTRFEFTVLLQTQEPRESWQQGTVRAGGEASKARLRILCAEDTPSNQDVLVAMLRELGVRAELAENGREALERLSQEPFDMVILDMQMPWMDGYEAARRIRAGECGAERSGVYLLALTAEATPGDRERCLDGGMNAYLAKPITLRSLEEAIGEAESHLAKGG